MSQRWWLKRNNDHQLNAFTEHVKLEWTAGRDVCVQFVDADRTDNQNRMIYGMYADIAKATDQLPKDVERYCKLHFGVPIRRSVDTEFCDWYDAQIKTTFDYAAKLLLMDHIDITSRFTKKQATTYIDTILQEYGPKCPIRYPRL